MHMYSLIIQKYSISFYSLAMSEISKCAFYGKCLSPLMWVYIFLSIVHSIHRTGFVFTSIVCSVHIFALAFFCWSWLIFLKVISKHLKFKLKFKGNYVIIVIQNTITNSESLNSFHLLSCHLRDTHFRVDLICR